MPALLSLQSAALPKPPYHYKNVCAVFLRPGDDPNVAWLAGHFPQAPTGPFNEIWKMKKTEHAWSPEHIVVDNQVRYEAGIRFWGLPKQLGPVRCQMERFPHKLEFNCERFGKKSS